MEVSAFFWKYAQEQKQLMIAMVAMAMAAPAIDLVLLPRLYVRLIGVVGTTGHGTQKALNHCLGLILSSTALLQGVHVVRSALVTYMRPSFDAYMKSRLLKQILTRDTSCNVLTSGDIVYLLSTMSDLSRTWIEWWNNQILPHGALLVCAFIVFFRLDAFLASMFLAFLVTLVLTVHQTTQMSASGAQEHVVSMSKLHKHLEDIIRNAHTIQNADMVDGEVHRLKVKMIPASYEGYRKAFAQAQKLQTIMTPIGVLFMLVFLRRVIQLRQDGRVSQNQFVAVFFVVATLISTFTWLMDNMGKVIVEAQHFQYMSKSLMQYANPSPPWSKRLPLHRPPPDAVMGMEDVVFTYQGNLVFSGRSLGFIRGERAAVVGAVGSGKSTLLRLLLGFCVPDRGNMYLEGKWYGELTVAEIRRRIGLVPQDIVLFDMSVVQNVRYGNEETHSEAAVLQFVLQNAGHVLGDRVYADSVGAGGQELSGGQRQLVWCLRMMLRAPPILLMDEPTAFMDKACKAVLIGLLDDARKRGATILLVTHDPFLLSYCDRIVDLSNG